MRQKRIEGSNPSVSAKALSVKLAKPSDTGPPGHEGFVVLGVAAPCCGPPVGLVDRAVRWFDESAMTARTLYDKLWDDHVVHTEEDGTAVLYIDRHLVHEVTSPQAFEGLRLAQRPVWRVSSVVATADHNTPTTGWELGYDGITDPTSKQQVVTLDANIKAFGAAAYFPFLDQRQGIVHVIGPENGATLPGMTVVCGDSHTSTHGAFGALAAA